MLRNKLFRNLALVVLLFGVLSVGIGIMEISKSLVAEGQKRARLDLSSAWAVKNGEMTEIETVVRMAASKESVVQLCRTSDWNNGEIRARLERIRTGFGLDFLGLICPDGRVVIRTAPPYNTGDYLSNPVLTKALHGAPTASMELLSADQLDHESDGLREQAFTVVEDTPQARPMSIETETRGMVMLCAAPVMDGQRVAAVVYGGILVNRNHELVDHIKDVIYKDETYKGSPVGTATIFLNDVRIATTARSKNGNRAIGTRVSKQVADTVLDNGRPWTSKAFVVSEWYLTAYEPIQDCSGKIIGMLYVGILKRPFDDSMHNVIVGYLAVCLVVLVVGLTAAYVTAGRLARPIHMLVDEANRLEDGKSPEPLPPDRSCTETAMLVQTFNRMAMALYEREQKLKAVNKNYMEMLSFVSHEIKSPVSTIMNYSYGLLRNKLGVLNPDQTKAVASIEAASKRLAEMVRHYLNLSKIENCEMEMVPSKVIVNRDVLTPLFQALEPDTVAAGMKIACSVPEDCTVMADPNMTREVFENIIGNAVKYGRQNGAANVTCKDSGDGMIEFTIRNDGQGIPSDRLGDVFNKFVRIGTDDHARTKKGTGLGLFITKQIVEAHGGTITVFSDDGKWAEFRFTLPADKTTQRN